VDASHQRGRAHTAGPNWRNCNCLQCFHQPRFATGLFRCGDMDVWRCFRRIECVSMQYPRCKDDGLLVRHNDVAPNPCSACCEQFIRDFGGLHACQRRLRRDSMRYKFRRRQGQARQRNLRGCGNLRAKVRLSEDLSAGLAFG